MTGEAPTRAAMGAAAAITKNAIAMTPSLSRARLGWAASSIGRAWWFGPTAVPLELSLLMVGTFFFWPCWSRNCRCPCDPAHGCWDDSRLTTPEIHVSDGHTG